MLGVDRPIFAARAAAPATRAVRWIAAWLSLALVAGCMAAPGLSPSPSPTSGPVTAASPSARPPAATPVPSATPLAEPLPIAGTWRVRKILSRESRSALIPGSTFDDEAFVVTPDCENEPCPTVEIEITPLGRAQPVTVAALTREGDRYVSAAQAENEGPCLDAFGDRVQGGATVSSTMRLWAARVRPQGTAVESVQSDRVDRPAPGPDDHRFGGRVRRADRHVRAHRSPWRGRGPRRSPARARPAAEHGGRGGRAALDQRQGRGRHGLVLPDRRRHDPRTRQEPGRGRGEGVRRDQLRVEPRGRPTGCVRDDRVPERRGSHRATARRQRGVHHPQGRRHGPLHRSTSHGGPPPSGSPLGCSPGGARSSCSSATTRPATSGSAATTSSGSTRD